MPSVKGGGGIYGVSKDPSGGVVGGGEKGGTREGSRLGSRGRRRHTMGTALYMHVYYIIRRAPRVCTTQEGSLWGGETIGGAAAAAKYNQTNVQYYYIYTYQIPSYYQGI